MNSILVIDDEYPRLDWFIDTIESTGEYDVRVANDADTALDQLCDSRFDVVFFDHDIGSFSRHMRGPPNGSRLLGFVLHNTQKYYLPHHIWIHSMNPIGVKNIASKCQSADIPYVIGSYSDLVDDSESFLESLKNFLTVD